MEIAKDLSCNHHINNIAQSAHRSTNFLRRNISKCSADTKQASITGMKNQIQKLERIQSKAARFVLNCYDLMTSVTQMRQELGWPTLQSHRFTARMTMCYKAVHGLVHLSCPDYLTLKSRTMRGEHTNQYTVVQTRTDVFKYSFFPRTIRCWNILTVTLIEKPPVDSFKTGLYTALQDKGPSIWYSQKEYMTGHDSTVINSCLEPCSMGEEEGTIFKTCI